MSFDVEQFREHFVDTLTAIASLPDVDDDTFADMLLEALDIDARSFLSNETLDQLVGAGLLSSEDAGEVSSLRQRLLEKIQSVHESKNYLPAAIRTDPFWPLAASKCKALLGMQS
jgi:hypothetical protein